MFTDFIRWIFVAMLVSCALIGASGCSNDADRSGVSDKPTVVDQSDNPSGDTDTATLDVPEPKQEQLRPTTVEELIEVFDAADYRFGVSVEKSELLWQEKFQRFARNAEVPDPIALASLYYCYSKGLGTEKNQEKAFAYAKSAAEPRSPQNVTHAAGKHVLGEAYLYGVGVSIDEAAGIQLIEEAAKRAFPLSRFEVGRRFVKRAFAGERLMREEQVLAIESLTQAHEAGILKAKTLLGQLYLKGAVVERPDLNRGMQLIDEAAKAGHPHAQNVAFTVYQIGAPPAFPKNLRLAREFLESAAAAGDSESQFQLAAAFLQHGGLNVELGLAKDHQQAFKWGTLSAAQDHPRGHFLLSVMHEFGYAPDGKDEALARKHLDEAVKIGEPGAIARKGNALVIGELYERDVAQGLKLLREAAALGNKSAIATLKQFE